MTTHWWSPLFNAIRARWVVLRRILIAVFAVIVISLLVLAVMEVDWHAVMVSLRKLPFSALAWAAGLTMSSYALYSSFDLLGRWYTGHRLVWWRTMLVGFISYAFTMSMGAPVGGVGLRVRLYSKQGLQQGVIMRVLATSLATNWVGYLIVTGVVLGTGHVNLPEKWELGNTALRFIGLLCFAAGLAYILASAYSKKRSWTIGGHTIELPDVRLAMLQGTLGALNWLLISAVIFALFQGRASYFEVLAILLISAIVGAAAHVPGGIGVLEYVFITMLGPDAARSEVLAVLVVYRLFYYIIPLLIAGLAYLGAEARIRTVTRPHT